MWTPRASEDKGQALMFPAQAWALSGSRALTPGCWAAGRKGAVKQERNEESQCWNTKNTFLPGNLPAPQSALKLTFQEKYLEMRWNRAAEI